MLSCEVAVWSQEEQTTKSSSCWQEAPLLGLQSLQHKFTCVSISAPKALGLDLFCWLHAAKQ
jgi:hypothetical protein